MSTLGDRMKTGWPLLVCLGVSGVAFFLPWVEIKIRYVGERQRHDPGPFGFLLSPIGAVLAGELLATQPVEVKALDQSGFDASRGTMRAEPRLSGWFPQGGMAPWSPLAAAYGLLLLGAFGCWCWFGDSRWGTFAILSCLALGMFCLLLIPGTDESLRAALDQKLPSKSYGLTRQSITIQYSPFYYGSVATTLGALVAALLISLRRTRVSRLLSWSLGTTCGILFGAYRRDSRTTASHDC